MLTVSICERYSPSMEQYTTSKFVRCTFFLIIGALILMPFIVPRPQGGHKGCGRVDFRHLEDAITAYQSGQAEPFYLMGRTLFVDYSSKTQGNKNHVLYFSYFTGNEEDIRTTLQEYEDRIDRIIFSECRLLRSSSQG